jgi:signal transduction histidine kinase
MGTAFCEENRIDGIEAGADDYVEKPFRARELLARVATHARMARLGRDAKAGIRLVAEHERAARAAAEQAGRMKDDFLTTLSHDLRTPLNAILGWTQLLTADGVDAATVQSGIQVIERNARRQANLIADLLDLTRISAGKLALSLTDLDLGEAIAAAVDSIVPSAEAKGVRVRAVAASARITVRADADRLQQILSNLLANAIKFTPSDGTVRISAARRGREAEIVVADTGIGIAPELLSHVFERYRQGDAGSRRHEGLGLGLAIVKHLVGMHGGAVSAESQGEGQGATFTVRLPVVAESTP